jgi:glutamate transport system substrate-binding protein
MDLEPRRPWPEPAHGSRTSPGTWSKSVLWIMRWRGRLRAGRIGCLLILLVIAALWVLGRAVDGVTALFSDHPAPVAGRPFDTVPPARPASSGSPAIDRIVLRGKLIVAIQEAPGLVQRSPDSGDYTGFDVALLGLIARDLGVDPARTSFKPLATSSREAALGRAEADLVLGGYEITAARSAKVGIAGPYLVRPLRLAVPATSPVTGLNSLGHGEVCAPADSAAAAALADRGVGLQTRATLSACANLLGKRVEAIAGDQAAVAALLSQAPGTLRVVGEPLGTTEYGIGLPPGDPLLRERVTAVLRHAIDDGTWARLYAEYLGTPVPSPPVLR